MDRKIILFELNEVPLKILDFYVQARPRSALARILPRAARYETYTEDGGHLSPWVTWPTLHRGVTNHRHGISDFGQALSGIDRDFPPIWRILAGSGVRTGVGGSLHSFVQGESFDDYAFYIPDIFAGEPTCWPRDLERFQAFCLGMARDSAKNVNDRMPAMQAARVLLDAPRIGLRATTLADVAGQLLNERLKPWTIVRRRTYQAVLAYDVFERQLRRERPAFSTFFTNHVASAMHRYWQASFPQDYEKLSFDEEWLRTYQGEILFAMDKADRMIGRLADFVEGDGGYCLLIASSMGQDAVETRPVETMLYVTRPEPFLEALGLQRGDWEPRPAMFPQLNIQVAAGRRAAFREAVESVRVNGLALGYRAKDDGFFSIDFGHENFSQYTVSIAGREYDAVALGIANVEIQDKAGVTAYHVPHGSLLVYGRKVAPGSAATQVSTVDIAPSILRNYGVEPPAYMSRGSALLG